MNGVVIDMNFTFFCVCCCLSTNMFLVYVFIPFKAAHAEIFSPVRLLLRAGSQMSSQTETHKPMRANK